MGTEGTLRKISGKNDQERHVFLFSDCFMYCKKKSNTEYTCRGIIYLHKLELEDISDTFSFKIVRHDKSLTCIIITCCLGLTDAYIFYGKSKQEKETWMHEIRTQQAKIGVTFNRSRTSLLVVVTSASTCHSLLEEKRFDSCLSQQNDLQDICNHREHMRRRCMR